MYGPVTGNPTRFAVDHWHATCRGRDLIALAITEDDLIGYVGGSALQVREDGGKTWRVAAALEPAALAHSGSQILANTELRLLMTTDSGQT
jgi:hypothetical protein